MLGVFTGSELSESVVEISRPCGAIEPCWVALPVEDLLVVLTASRLQCLWLLGCVVQKVTTWRSMQRTEPARLIENQSPVRPRLGITPLNR